MTTDTTDTAMTAAPTTRGRRAKAAAPASTPPARKSDAVVKLLLRAKGATAAELIAATDWQPHSLRAFVSGLRKKGRVVVREVRKNGESAYRIEGAAIPASAPPEPAIDSPATTTVEA